MIYITFPKQDTINYTLDMLYSHAPLPDYTTDIVYNTIRKDFTKTKNGLVNCKEYPWLQSMLLNTHTVPKSYTQFKIPKASGGYRIISAPNDTLKEAQQHINTAFTSIKTHPHNCVYSYVQNRTCKDALIKHRDAHTKWFYKFDIKDFFPSCTAEVLTASLKNKVYPFCFLSDDEWNGLLYIALYDNALPQGSPLSPLLSNMVLTPFDFYMYYSIKHFKGVYTRYADDITISLPEKKDISFLENIINNHLHTHVHPSLKLNKQKSRCGSIAGSNWNLGLILNKDHNITIGHKRKQELKAKINNFIYDFTNQKFWSIIETQSLQGEINYFENIEPDYAQFVIKRLESKYKSNDYLIRCNTLTLKSMMKHIITS